MLSGICASARSWVVTKPMAPRCTSAPTTNRVPAKRSSEFVPESNSSRQKQYRDRTLRRVGNQFETLDLGVEPGDSALQRIQHTNRCADREARHPQPFRSYGRTTLRQNRVHAYPPDKCAFSRHIWPAEDDQLQAVTQLQVVPDSFAFGQEGMRERLRVEAWALISNSGHASSGCSNA